MSRSDRLMNRIEEALRGVKVETSDLFLQDIRQSEFGMVDLVTFLWRVGDDDASADDIARQVSSRLAEKNICVIFHKTRRQQGERLLTAAKALECGHSNYSYGNLYEFTRNWLIEVTQASEGKHNKHSPKKQQDHSRFRFRL